MKTAIATATTTDDSRFSAGTMKKAADKSSGSSSSVDCEVKDSDSAVVVRFRWYPPKSWTTLCTRAYLTAPFSKERISLDLCTMDDVRSYVGKELAVDCGKYSGCCLRVDAVDYLLDNVEVKHYSVEVDLYIDDDDPENARNLENTSKVLVSPISSHPPTRPSSSPVSDINTVRTKLTPTTASEAHVISFTGSQAHVIPPSCDVTCSNSDVVRARNMDDVIEDDDVRSEVSSTSSSRRLGALENLLRHQIASKDLTSSFSDDRDVRESNGSDSRTGGGKEVFAGTKGVGHEGPGHGSVGRGVLTDRNLMKLQQTHNDQGVGGLNSRSHNIRSNYSNSRTDGFKNSINNVSNHYDPSNGVRSGSSSSRQSLDESMTIPIGSSSTPSSRTVDSSTSGSRGSTPSLTAPPPILDLEMISPPDSNRSTPTNDVDRADPKLSFRHYSGSSRDERQAAVTSQDSTRLAYGTPRPGQSGEGRFSGQSGEGRFSGQSGEGRYSPSNRVAVSPQRAPDVVQFDATYRYRSPLLTSPLITSRGVLLKDGGGYGLSSPGGGSVFNRFSVQDEAGKGGDLGGSGGVVKAGQRISVERRGTEASRQQDLEITVTSLKELLERKDGEMTKLMESNGLLQKNMAELKLQLLQDNEDGKTKSLIREKENLATQLWRMKQELDKVYGQRTLTDQSGGRLADKDVQTKDHKLLSDHNGTISLQRDVKSHSGEFDQASNNIVAKLNDAEETIVVLRNENNRLRSEAIHGGVSQDLLTENLLLKEQLRRALASTDRLYGGGEEEEGRGDRGDKFSRSYGRSEDDEEEATTAALLRQEVERLREEMHSLRDDNHALTQDNIRLTEYIKDIQTLHRHRSPSISGCTSPSGRMMSTSSSLCDLSSNVMNIKRPNSRVRIPSTDSTDDQDRRLSHNSLISTDRTRTTSPSGRQNIAPTRTTAPPLSVTLPELRTSSGSLSPNRSPAKILLPVPSTTSSVGKQTVGEEEANQTRITDQHRHTDSVRPTVYKTRDVLPQGKQDSNTTGHPRSDQNDKTGESSEVHRGSSESSRDGRPSYDIEDGRRATASDASAADQRTAVTGAGRDPRRLSISSTSTESILMEADLLLSLTNGAMGSDGDVMAASQLRRAVVVTSSSQDLVGGGSQSTRAVVNGPAGNVMTTASPAAASDREYNLHEGSFSSSAKRPFAPRSPADISLGDVIKFSRQGGKISKGEVKYIGNLPNKNDTYFGVELLYEMGKHDGVYDGQRYFQCKPSRGVFVAFCKVVMSWRD